MSDVPVNRPDSFGAPSHSAAESSPLTTVNILSQAPAPQPGRPRPSVQRLVTAPRANLIVFSFLPGQSLPDHKAAHPITVQCLRGTLLFTCGEDAVELNPGVVCHLPAYVVHRVDCPENTTTGGAQDPAVLLLTMLTAEDETGGGAR